MNCIKTGAYIYLEEYRAYAPADLFQVGDDTSMVILAFNYDEETRELVRAFQPLRRVTHTARAEHAGFTKRGIWVLPNKAPYFQENAP